MAISTYSELRTAVENWLDHALFTSRVPEFIALFEATANRRLRVREQEATGIIATTSGAGTLPTDYLSWRSVLSIASDVSTDLEYVTPSYLTALYPTSPSGSPRHFTIRGTTLHIRPVPTTESIALLYFQKIPALSDSATTNWLLTAHPDLYLFGSLVEAEMFGVNDERGGLWKGRVEEIFNEIEKLSNKTRGAGTIKVMSVTP